MEIKKDNAGYIVKWNVRKPCPFCGEKAIIDVFEEAEPYESSYYYAGERLSCSGCGVSMKSYKVDYATKDTPYYDVQYDWDIKLQMRKDLLARWNKRTNHA